MSELNEVELFLLTVLIMRKRKHKRKSKRKVWVKDIFQQRKQKGAYNQLITEMLLTDRESYFRKALFFIF